MTEATAKLSILETTDLHMQVLPYDYFTDSEAAATGLRQLACLIDQKREQAQNTLLFDNGDFLQGNAMADSIQLSPQSTLPHPMIAAMNALDYDAVGLGNHEFNLGLEFLEQALAHARFPVVCSNLDVTGYNIAAPELLMERSLQCSDGNKRQIKIGVFGVLPPQISVWDYEVLKDAVSTFDIVQTAQNCAQALRRKGADLVIALCHSGIGASEHEIGQENAVIPLAAITEIDAVLAGHTHSIFPDPNMPACAPIAPEKGKIHGTPVVQAGFNGNFMGQIDLNLVWGKGTWRVLSSTSRLEAAPEGKSLTATAQQIDQIAQNAHQQTLHYIREPIAKLEAPINSHFTMVAGDLALATLAAAQKSVLLAESVASGLADLPVVSAVSPFAAGGWAGPQHFIDLKDPELKISNATAIYPFSNTIHAVKLTVADLRIWLERSARAFNVVKQNVIEQPLLDNRHPTYFFDVFYGLDYEIDLSRDQGRIGPIRFAGRVLHDTDQILVVTNSYRANGGGEHLAGLDADIAFRSDTKVRDALISYLRTMQSIPLTNTPPWRFTALDGTTARFLSSPHADPRSEPARDIRATGRQVDGFAEFEIKL